jgi:hypothetical protein
VGLASHGSKRVQRFLTVPRHQDLRDTGAPKRTQDELLGIRVILNEEDGTIHGTHTLLCGESCRNLFQPQEACDISRKYGV